MPLVPRQGFRWSLGLALVPVPAEAALSLAEALAPRDPVCHQARPHQAQGPGAGLPQGRHGHHHRGCGGESSGRLGLVLPLGGHEGHGTLVPPAELPVPAPPSRRDPPSLPLLRDPLVPRARAGTAPDTTRRGRRGCWRPACCGSVEPSVWTPSSASCREYSWGVPGGPAAQLRAQELRQRMGPARFPPARFWVGSWGQSSPEPCSGTGGICWGQCLALRTPSCAHPARMDLMGWGFTQWALRSLVGALLSPSRCRHGPLS